MVRDEGQWEEDKVAPPLRSLSCSWTALRGPFGERPSAAALEVCSQVFFYEVQSELLFPPTLRASFPEGEEFSLNPEEKYLYVGFYDLKSVHAIDLSPLLAGGKLGLYCTAFYIYML